MADMLPAGAQASTATASSTGSTQRVALFWVALGLALAFGPTWWDFSIGRAAADSQGHELVIVAIAGWLIYRQRAALAALSDRPRNGAAAALLALGLLLYVFGRSLGFLRAELVSMVVVVVALLVGYKGWRGLRLMWFPLVFMLFIVPLPYGLVMALTGPLKVGVSAVTAWLLSGAGYPIGRTGVIITIGQYELLVSTACAGLQTMFTLEALGLVYVNVRGHSSALHNGLLALLAVPVSFCANTIRVTILCLITYHLGDDAGRGFVHGFAGLVLFSAALMLIMAVDRLLGSMLSPRHSP